MQSNTTQNYNDCLVIPISESNNTTKDILNSVLGQLSDGIWENSRIMTHYWPYASVKDIEGKTCIVIKLTDDHYFYGGFGNNWFKNCGKLNKDVVAIKKWFAEKLKAVVAEDRKDHPHLNLKFKENNKSPLNYISYYDASSKDITVAEAYAVYKMLLSA